MVKIGLHKSKPVMIIQTCHGLGDTESEHGSMTGLLFPPKLFLNKIKFKES